MTRPPIIQAGLPASSSVNPFAAIQSYADIIVEGYTGPITEQTRDIMGKIKVRCELLAHAIKGMLDLASLRSCDRDKDKFDKARILEQAGFKAIAAAGYGLADT